MSSPHQILPRYSQAFEHLYHLGLLSDRAPCVRMSITASFNLGNSVFQVQFRSESPEEEGINNSSGREDLVMQTSNLGKGLKYRDIYRYRN